MIDFSIKRIGTKTNNGKKEFVIIGKHGNETKTCGFHFTGLNRMSIKDIEEFFSMIAAGINNITKELKS